MTKLNDGNFFTAVVAALGAICGFLFGELTGLLIAVIVLMIIDYITGLASSFVLKTTDSKVSWRGIIKKLVMFMILIVAHILDVYVLNLGEGTAAIMPLVEFLFIANEGLSIIENAGKLGIKLPKALRNALVQLKMTANSETENPQTKKEKNEDPDAKCK